jgi:hypothetical protein
MLVERLDAEGQRHATHGAEQVDRHRILRARAVAQHRVLEQQRRAAAGLLQTRSAISVSSRSTFTGCVMRCSSPMRSIASRKSGRVSRPSVGEDRRGQAEGRVPTWIAAMPKREASPT